MKKPGPLKDFLAAVERKVISEQITEHHWNISKTAKALGISRMGLVIKLKAYSLVRPGTESEVKSE